LRLLIASPRDRLGDSVKLAEALANFGVKTVCIHDREYYAFSEFKVLKHVPFPKLLRLIKRFQPNFTFTYVPYYTAHMAKLLSQPLLIHLRGDIWTESQWHRTLYHALPRRMLFEWKTLVVTRGIKKADLILPVSRWLEKQVKQRLPNHPTHVLYRGVDSEKWRAKPNIPLFKFKRPAVVGVFEFTIYPKVTGLLKFMKCLEKMPDVNFYFAGSGPYINLVKRNCPSNMHLIGRLSKFGVQRLLASGDLFVHPSALDALPRSVVEASLMEKPIVASSVGGMPEIIDNNKTGYLCDVNNTEHWVEKIRFLLDNPNFAKSMGKNARRLVMEKFDWKKIAKDFVERLTEQAS